MQLVSEQKRLDKIVILGDDYPLLRIRNPNDFKIRRTITRGQVEGVYRIMARLPQLVIKTVWQLRIHQKFHAARRFMRFTWATRAA